MSHTCRQPRPSPYVHTDPNAPPCSLVPFYPKCTAHMLYTRCARSTKFLCIVHSSMSLYCKPMSGHVHCTLVALLLHLAVDVCVTVTSPFHPLPCLTSTTIAFYPSTTDPPSSHPSYIHLPHPLLPSFCTCSNVSGQGECSLPVSTSFPLLSCVVCAACYTFSSPPHRSQASSLHLR